MSVVIVGDKVNAEDIEMALQDHDGYIKIVIDVEIGQMAIGGEWHADAEKELLNSGSHQKNLWGGGITWPSKTIDFISLINTRPNFNNSQEILDAKIRSQFEIIVKNKFEL